MNMANISRQDGAAVFQ